MTKRGNTIFKWVCLVLLIGYSAWITIWAHEEASRHVCKGISVVVDAPAPIDSIVGRGVVEELSRYPSKIKGVPIDQINTREIEDYLGALSTFESVNCVVTAAGELQVHVVPMVPVMRVFFADNSYYINKDGKHIASNAEFFSDVPVVTGDFTHEFQPHHILPLVRFISEDPMMRDLTSMIVARDSRNLIIVPPITGHVVNFGDTTRLAEKRDALKLFYRKVMPYKGWEQYDTISVKFKGQIVATRRDKTKLNVTEDPIEEVDLEEGTLPDAPATASQPVKKPESDAENHPAETPGEKPKPQT